MPWLKRQSPGLSIMITRYIYYNNITSVSFLTERVISVCSVSNVLNCIHMHSKRGRYATSRTFLYPPCQVIGGFLLFGVAWETIYYGRQVGIIGFDDQKSSCRAKVLRNHDWLSLLYSAQTTGRCSTCTNCNMCSIAEEYKFFLITCDLFSNGEVPFA